MLDALFNGQEVQDLPAEAMSHTNVVHGPPYVFSQ